MKQKKYNEELNLASGTEMMRASRQRPTVFQDKTKYTRKDKHKNRHDKISGDSLILG
jgi:hypothetical protein